jgi:hypothetical protein
MKDNIKEEAYISSISNTVYFVWLIVCNAISLLFIIYLLVYITSCVLYDVRTYKRMWFVTYIVN